MEGEPDIAGLRQSLAAAGFDPSTYQAPAPHEVWPDCWQPLAVLRAMGTQWNVGPAGPIGLRYEALAEVWRCLGIKKADRQAVFADLQVMEREALIWTQERQRHD